MKRPSTFRWPRLTTWPLALEITLVLMIKIAILFAIKKAFFSNPLAKKMLVPMPQVEQHLLSGAVKPHPAPVLKANTLNPTQPTTQEKYGSD